MRRFGSRPSPRAPGGGPMFYMRPPPRRLDLSQLAYRTEVRPYGGFIVLVCNACNDQSEKRCERLTDPARVQQVIAQYAIMHQH